MKLVEDHNDVIDFYSMLQKELKETDFDIIKKSSRTEKELTSQIEELKKNQIKKVFIVRQWVVKLNLENNVIVREAFRSPIDTLFFTKTSAEEYVERNKNFNAESNDRCKMTSKTYIDNTSYFEIKEVDLFDGVFISFSMDNHFKN